MGNQFYNTTPSDQMYPFKKSLFCASYIFRPPACITHVRLHLPKDLETQRTGLNCFVQTSKSISFKPGNVYVSSFYFDDFLSDLKCILNLFVKLVNTKILQEGSQDLKQKFTTIF